MAAPHVAGAWAILRQAFPSKGVGSIRRALDLTGEALADPRCATAPDQRRIRIDRAIDALRVDTWLCLGPSTGFDMAVGSLVSPFKTLAEAIAAVPNGGSLGIIGTCGRRTGGAMIITKAMTIRAYRGSIVIGE